MQEAKKYNELIDRISVALTRSSRSGGLILVTFLLLLLLALNYEPEVADQITQQTEMDSKGNPDSLYEVTRVVDGDTIEVIYQGKPERVRLIGIDAPEKSPAECFAEESTALLETLLPVGSMVTIQFDDTQTERDRYNRLLLYVWADELLINEEMIRLGAAEEYTYNKPYLYQLRFRDREISAEKGNIGMWGEQCACKIEATRTCSTCEVAEITQINWDCSITKSTVRDSSCVLRCDN